MLRSDLRVRLHHPKSFSIVDIQQVANFCFFWSQHCASFRKGWVSPSCYNLVFFSQTAEQVFRCEVFGWNVSQQALRTAVQVYVCVRKQFASSIMNQMILGTKRCQKLMLGSECSARRSRKWTRLFCLCFSDLTGAQDGSVRMFEWGHSQQIICFRSPGNSRVTRIRFNHQGNKVEKLHAHPHTAWSELFEELNTNLQIKLFRILQYCCI